MPGKIDAPLGEKLQAVKWGEYRLGDLFEIENTLSFNSDRLVDGAEYDYITRTSLNQGILQTTGFVNEENINPAGTWSLGLLQMDFFYRNKPWYAGQFVRKIVPKITIPENAILFFQTLLNLQKPILLQVLVRHVDETFRNTKIHLPQMQDGNIDFDFMESFIRELEEERIRELEEERIRELSAYLTVSGLSDTKLSDREEAVLLHFKDFQWEEFKIGDLYTKVELNNKKFDKRRDTRSEQSEEFSLPVVNAKHGDNGIMFYGSKDIFDSVEMTIDIVQNGAVATGDVYPQPQKTGVLWDAYLIKATNHCDSRLSLFFMAASIRKSIKLKFSYEFKATWDRVQEEYVYLPTKDGTPDYDSMETFISAVQKLVIKDVVKYAEDKINATKKVVKNKDEYKTTEVKSFLSVAESAEYKEIPR